jgi:hypothetical protein
MPDAEYRGRERLALLTGGRSGAAFALGIVLAFAKILYWLHVRGHWRTAPPPPPAPPAVAAATAQGLGPSASRSDSRRDVEQVLNGIRARGYRVTVHHLIGSIEMRAVALADPAQVYWARVEQSASSSGDGCDDELRCARALAGKLAIHLERASATRQ